MKTKNLDETSFPLYCIECLNNECFVVGGGGGAAKTGVKNAIHFYKLIRDGNSYKADNICVYDTQTMAVMNLNVNPERTEVAVGVDHLCRIYSIKEKKGKISLEEKKSVASVKESKIDEDGEYQKCVRYTHDKKFIITASSDGSCKVFNYPTLEEKFHIKAHSDDIDDLDVHPNSKLFVTVSKEQVACLWKIRDGKKELELPFSLDKKDEDFYRFRNCRFSENKDSNNVYLYSTHIPKKYSKEKAANCIVRWNTHKWIPEITVFVKNHTLSALDVSAIGRYLAVGTAEGSILVYTTWNMKHLRTVNNVHDIFITGLSFVPENKMLCEDMKQDAAIISCSIDNKCQITCIPSRAEFPIIIVLVLFLVAIFLIFNAITYLDLEF